MKKYNLITSKITLFHSLLLPLFTTWMLTKILGKQKCRWAVGHIKLDQPYTIKKP